MHTICLCVLLQGLSSKVSLLHRLSVVGRREERLFKPVLDVSTGPSPLSLMELEMADEKRLKVLDEGVSHFSELLWSDRERKGRGACVRR